MSFEFHKNAVITGCVNSFCLACDSFLESKQDALLHIETSMHRQRLSMVHYSERFKDQGISKFELGYFCECCNILLHTASKVNLHIAEEYHKQNRGTILLKAVEHGVVAFNTVLIKERIWHGLEDNSCSICDIEFNDESQHKRNTAHILSLIQKPIKFGANDAIYRQIDDSTVQCLTCDLLVPSKTISEHIDDADHLDMYDKCKIEANHINKNTQNRDQEIKQNDENINFRNVTEPTNEEDRDKICAKLNSSELIPPSIEMYQNESIDINLVTETVFCRKCCVAIKFDHNDVEKHIQEHMETELEQTQSVKRYPTDVKRNDENTNIRNVTELTNEEKKDQICDKLNSSELIPSIEIYQNENIDINLVTETAFCRKCWVALKFDHNDIEMHIQDHMETELEQNESVKRYPTDVKQKIYSLKAGNDAHNENEDCKSDSSEGNIKKLPLLAMTSSQNVENHDANAVSASINSSSKSINRGKNRLELEVIKYLEAGKDAVDENEDCKSDSSKGNIKTLPLLAMTSAQNVEKHDANVVSASINSSSKSTNRSKNRIEPEVIKDPVDVQRFAEENDIHYREATWSNCFICKVKIPSTMRSIKEHLKGGSHLKKLAVLDCTLEKVDMKSFVFSLRHLRLERHFTQSFVINEQHCINELSYYMIVENKSGLRCLLCETNLNCDRIFYKKHVDDHVTNTSHLSEMEKMPVITAVKTDFIREIRPRRFHCGCCNCVVTGWTMMKRHLLSQEHKDLIGRGHKITVVFNR